MMFTYLQNKKAALLNISIFGLNTSTIMAATLNRKAETPIFQGFS